MIVLLKLTVQNKQTSKDGICWMAKNNEVLLNNVWFPDEAHVHLDGVANKVSSCEYIEEAVADSRQGVVRQLESFSLGVGLTTPRRKNELVTKICKKPRT
jgi:hypothetical protein